MTEYEESVELLFDQYCKIVKANLTDDTYVTVKGEDKNAPTTLSDWCRRFAETGVYHHDRLSFTQFTSISNLRKLFDNCHSKRTVFRYRRLMDSGQYRWVSITLFPCKDYSPSNQTVLIYVRDIQDDYCYQLKEYRKIQYLSTHDAETGYKNKIAFDTEISNPDYYYNTVGIIKTMEPTRLKKLLDEFLSNSDIYRTDEAEITFLSQTKSDLDLQEFSKAIGNYAVGFGYARTDEPSPNLNRLIFEAEEMIYEQN